MMKKYIKTIILFLVMAGLCIGYFYYLSNREPVVDSTQKAVTNQELSSLLTMDINKNYPPSPRQVVDLYSRITKIYYKDKLSDDDIRALASQARLMFDQELIDTQSDIDFFLSLKEEIARYNSLGRFVSDYQLDGSGNEDYINFQNNRYAKVCVTYYVREGSGIANSRTEYTLRKDSDGRWKILFWKLAD